MGWSNSCVRCTMPTADPPRTIRAPDEAVRRTGRPISDRRAAGTGGGLPTGLEVPFRRGLFFALTRTETLIRCRRHFVAGAITHGPPTTWDRSLRVETT